MASYTYDPTKINDQGKDQMRFELGDTITEGGALTCPLCDEEYVTLIHAEKKWMKAKLRCLEAIAMKLSLDEDSTSVSGLSYSNTQRAQRWLAMYQGLKKELKGRMAFPIGAKGSMGGAPYFYQDLHKSPYRE